MIDYKHKDLFLSMDSDKQIKIAFSGGIITNSDMQQGSFNLSESLCSESNLRFGSCEASILKFRVHNVFSPLKGETLTVSEILDGLIDEPFSYGIYKVDSDKATVDREYRDVVAYDSMYEILNADVAEWYNGFFPEKSESEEETVLTLKDFRNSFFEHLGIEQEEITLANDGMVVEKTVEPEQLSGKQVINAICEINGCFGHIGRDGKFKYVHLETGEEWLFPSANLYPSESLFPKEGDSYLLNTSRYIPPATYEDYVTEKITGIVIRQEENDIGGQVGEMDNAYVIQDNFLVYGKGNDELLTIGNNILSVIKDIAYRPFSTKAKGNPCVEVGDAIRINSKTQRIDSYVLQRTLTGVTNLRDEYSADGEKKQPTEVNSLSRSIQQIKGKTNELTRTVEETKSSIKDVESGLSSEITQTASQIRTELQDTKEGLESSITQTAREIRSEVSDSDKDLQSQITQNAGSISSEITRATNAENALSTRITQTDEKIRSDVKATYETIEVVEEKTNAAKESANTYTDTRLSLYSTTEQMNSSIEQTASSITSSVDAKIAQTVTYIDTKAATAESNAKNDTANKLKSYSTTTEMNTAITQKADSISLSVDSKISETKQYAYNASQNAYTDAVDNTNEKLKSYSTTTEVESKIEASKNGILISVSETYETVSDAQKEYDSLRASIKVNSDNIGLKVSAGEVVNAINVSSEEIRLSGNRLVVNSTNFKLDEYGNAEFSGTISGGSISLETENNEIKTVMKTTIFSSGNLSLAINEADEFDYVDIHGPVYILGGSISESFLGVSEISCSNLEAYGDITCGTLNGEKPITSGNIYNYIPDTSDFVTSTELKEVSMGIMVDVNDLARRVSALEAAI